MPMEIHMSKIRAIDLFAGAGGFSTGAAMWLVNPFFVPAERKRRHDLEIIEAQKLERENGK